MLGQQPYADIDPFEMATYLKEGYRIAQPFNCPDELLVYSNKLSQRTRDAEPMLF